jgi:hypothetical protein
VLLAAPVAAAVFVAVLQALQYLAQHGAVVDVAAREIDTRASCAAVAGSKR